MKVLYYSLVVVIIDQITKILVKGIYIPFLNFNIAGIDKHQSIKVVGDFLQITFVENPGMAFGIGVNSGVKLFLSLFTIAAIIGVLYYLYLSKNEKFIFRFALALILGGAFGNLIDRVFYGVIYGYAPIFYGHVVDFINVEFFDFKLFGQTYERFPIFNIADSAVSIGVVLLLFFNKKEKEEKKVEDNVSENVKDLEQEETIEIQPDGKNNN